MDYDLLILDEPTAVLTPQEVDDFFVILKKMAAANHSLIFISHKLHEVIEISDQIAVLRDGRSVSQERNSNLTKTDLAEKMAGRSCFNMIRAPATGRRSAYRSAACTSITIGTRSA